MIRATAPDRLTCARDAPAGSSLATEKCPFSEASHPTWCVVRRVAATTRDAHPNVARLVRQVDGTTWLVSSQLFVASQEPAIPVFEAIESK